MVLIIFTVILAFASIAYTLATVSVEELRAEEALSTQSALYKAKKALLDYAITYEDSHPGEYGFLPCPDYHAGGIIVEGGSDAPCGAAKRNILGLFPWASLETGILKSGSGQCLWYGVSGEYKSDPKTNMLNQDTNGAIRLFDSNENIRQGALPQDRIVAVIIDPSKALQNQNRNFDNTSLCGKDYSPGQYLDFSATYNNAVLSGGDLDIDDFISGGVNTDQQVPAFNDQMVFITREELWNAVQSRKDFVDDPDSAMRRQTMALAMCIAAYGNNSGNRKLPRPGVVDFSGADYRLDSNYNDSVAVSYLGRYPLTVDDSDVALGGYAPNAAEEILFNKGYCSTLAVPGGPVINLDTAAQDEGYQTWKHWKDHFFYAVSSYYAPANGAAAIPSECGPADCVVVNGVKYAAVVLFAGKRVGLQVRNEPIAGDADTKNALANYIEVNNPAGDGTGDYTPTGNDVAFCITDADPFAVVSCP